MTSETFASPEDLNTAFLVDQYGTYERLHKIGPIHRVKTSDGVHAWFVTSYAEVRRLIGDRRLVRRRTDAEGAHYALPAPPPLTSSVLCQDPPAHTRLRKHMNKAFSVARVDAMTPRIQEVATGLADDLERGTVVDFMAEFAAPLPITVIAEVLGIPETDRHGLRTWGDQILSMDPAQMQQGGAQMNQFLMALMAEKRANPGDDIWSEWMATPDGGGAPLSTEELLGMGYIVLLGGYDPSARAIGSCVLALLSDPAKMELLRDNMELIPRAVEEFLRLYSSNHSATPRFATESIDVAEVTIEAGDVVLLSIAAADRDPAQFGTPNAAEFEGPNGRHIAFGLGPHYCPGAELSRRQVAISLETIIRRLPDLRLAAPPADIDLRESYFIRTPNVLPVICP
ncbi:cytochrome P450 family protein [Nocardia sp. bgisy118]|uniref:cytochrome P450 family protein n=1 Tax=Nocardia sp. bgisy118 TaxID=3413786 RepID=UPI003F49E88C